MADPYVPDTVPGDLNDPKKLQEFLDREHRKIAASISVASALTLEVLFVAPTKPTDGMLVLADGVSWNPGAGAGIYARIAGAWVKL